MLMQLGQTQKWETEQTAKTTKSEAEERGKILNSKHVDNTWVFGFL